jgi:hypothetical protein
VRASVAGGVCVVDTQLGKPRVGDTTLLGHVAWRTDRAGPDYAALTLTQVATVNVCDEPVAYQTTRNTFSQTASRGEKTNVTVGCDMDGRLLWWLRGAGAQQEQDESASVGEPPSMEDTTSPLKLVPGDVRACCALGSNADTLAVASGNTITLFRASELPGTRNT